MSTQIATRTDLRTLATSDKIKAQLADALPKFYTPDQFAICVRTAINKNPRLLECTPESFCVAMLTAAQRGLMPDGRNGHLIPRNKKVGNDWVTECTFQDDVKGLVGLVRRDLNVADVYAELVYTNDRLKIVRGLRRDIQHEEDDEKPTRGDLKGAYAVIIYKDGTTSFEYMSRDEIHSVRDHYSESWKKYPDNSPWKNSEGEMWKKTVLRRLFKLADLSPDIGERVTIDVDSTVTAHEQRLEIQRPTIGKPAAAQQIEDRPQDPPAQETQESASDPEPTKEEPAKEEPAAKEKPKLTRKPKKEEPVQEAKTVEAEVVKDEPAADTLEAKVAKRLADGGFTSGDLFRVAIENEWIADVDPDTAPLSAFGDSMLQEFHDEWENGKPGDRLIDVLTEKKAEREKGGK